MIKRGLQEEGKREKDRAGVKMVICPGPTAIKTRWQKLVS